MTIEEKSKRIEEWCSKQTCGESCLLFNMGASNRACYSIGSERDKRDVEENYEFIFGHEHDSVNHPVHYNKGKIEVWDFISDQGLNFDRGNAIKYICRAGTKDPDKEIQDLKKAIEYINHEIKMLKGETDNGTEKET